MFRNFRDCVRTVWAEFQNCFRTVWVEISGFYSDSLDIIFRNSFWVFLDSMESPLCLESNHMSVNSIWYPHNF